MDSQGLRARNVGQQPYVRVFDESDGSESPTNTNEDYGLKEQVVKRWDDFRRGHNTRVATYSPVDWLACFLPCVGWLRTYNVRFCHCPATCSRVWRCPLLPVLARGRDAGPCDLVPSTPSHTS
jgi:hypothetical protein